MKTKYENWMEDENAPELKRSNLQINVPSGDACAPCATCYNPIVVYRFVMHTQKSSPFHSVYFSTSLKIRKHQQAVSLERNSTLSSTFGRPPNAHNDSHQWTLCHFIPIRYEGNECNRELNIVASTMPHIAGLIYSLRVLLSSLNDKIQS